MGGSNFNALMHETLRYRSTMQQLEEENRELRRQIADLHDARGVFLEICGKRFALTGELTGVATPQRTPTIEEVSVATPELPITTALPDLSSWDSDFLKENEEEEETALAFLEEAAMNNTFTSAVTLQKQEVTNEAQKAALRRELMESFLLA